MFSFSFIILRKEGGKKGKLVEEKETQSARERKAGKGKGKGD